MAYALGCIVGAYYIVRVRSGRDIRASGSGNAGARNVLRSGDRIAAALTLVWDAGKGALAVLLAWTIWHHLFAGAVGYVAVIVGHIWPAQLRFHGGRGVAPAIGGFLVILAIAPPLHLGPPAFWAVIALGIAIVIAAHQPAFDRWRIPKENSP